MTQPLLLQYAERKPRRPGEAGILPSGALVDVLRANQLEVDLGTLTDGNCGYHAFGLGVLGVACEQFKGKAVMRKLRQVNTSGPLALVAFLRGEAGAWLRAHARDRMWDDISIRQMAIFMSSDQETWEGYLGEIGTMSKWADATALHALGCHFGVDVLVWQAGMDPAILGVSAGDDGAQNAQDPPLISAAMENDRHFWAVHPLREDIVPVAGGDAGDWTGPHTDSRGPAAGSRKRKASGDALAFPGVAAAYEDEDEEADEGIPCEIAFAPQVVLSGEAVDRELRFCQVLRGWDPWALPTGDVIDAIQGLAGAGLGATDASRALVRAAVLEDIAYEEAAGEAMQERLKYHATARLRLARQVQTPQGVTRRENMTAHIATRRGIDVSKLAEKMVVPCWRNGTPHKCYGPFRGNVGAVRNWRVLWHSLCPSMRTELLTMLHAGQPGQGKSYSFMGYKVCQHAFTVLAGVGGSSLVRARTIAPLKNCDRPPLLFQKSTKFICFAIVWKLHHRDSQGCIKDSGATGACLEGS